MIECCCALFIRRKATKIYKAKLNYNFFVASYSGSNSTVTGQKIGGKCHFFDKN